MPRHIRLNAFHMNAPGHSWPGLWAHPRDRSSTHDTPGYWTHLARTAERGKLDAVFLADVIGVYDVYGGTPDAALRSGAQAPTLDPFPVVPLMAAVTEHIGFGVTATLSYEQALRAGPALFHPGPSDRRAGGLEHRHRHSGQRRARHGAKRPERA